MGVKRYGKYGVLFKPGKAFPPGGCSAAVLSGFFQSY